MAGLRRLLGRRTDDTSTQFDVDLHGVRESTIAIGDKNAIHTPAGTRVIRTIGSEAVPEPRLKPLPVADRADAAEPFFGRASEVALGSQAAPSSPFQVHGPEGVGKSALLEQLAFGLPQGSDGVVHGKVRRRGIYDIQARLFKAFWDCEVRFTPAPEEMPDFLAERRALIVLDDVGLDRADLEELLESSPGCTFVIGSEQQTLWSGRAHELEGLDDGAALELIELELGRPLALDQRGSAAAVVRALGGHPQRLVEAAARVRNGASSFDELAHGPTWEVVRTGPSPQELSEARQRILAVLRAADTPLGTERIADLAEVAASAGELAALECDGWVRSASPRYRLIRELPAGGWELSQDELVRRLGDWAGGRASAEEVADEAEAIEAALERETGEPNAKVALARAAERKLALAGMLDSWERVLHAGLGAARAASNAHDEAYMLHQLGSRALCVGQGGQASNYLGRALQLREQLGDKDGAEVTRANLDQLGGGGTRPPNGRGGGNGGGGLPRPRMWPLLAALAAVVVGVGIFALALGGSENTSNPTPKPVPPPKSPATGPPAIRVVAPVRGVRYAEGKPVLAAYACAPARNADLRTCDGSVPRGKPIETSKGRHVFRVVATDSAGRRTTVRIPYSAGGSGALADTIKPTIDVSSPDDGGIYAADASVTAEYSCTDEPGGRKAPTCRGDVPRGEAIDLTPGDHTFVVTARDRAGNEARKEVSYTVTRSEPEDTTDPTVVITTPEDGDPYDEGSTVAASYTCDDPGGSGIDSCDGPVENGDPIDTAAPGEHTFVVVAVDRAGNRTEQSVTYTVEEVPG